MVQRFQTVQRSAYSAQTTNKVLTNTLILLSFSSLFAAATAYMSFLAPHGAAALGPFGVMIIYMVILYGISLTAESSLGIPMVFALTGFLGYTLGPLLHSVIKGLSHGPEIVMASFLGTSMIFGGMFAYALQAKEDFSYLIGFLSITTVSIFALSLINVFFLHMPILSLFISCGILTVSSGYLLFNLSNIIRGGERNYIRATTALFIDLYNIFVSLLRILSALSSSRDR
jgi:modulator of FtsH protease